MERRTLLTGAIGLILANKVLAEPQANLPTKAGKTRTEEKMSEATIAGVYGLEEPELSNSNVVVLKAKAEERYVAIWIGLTEGMGISEHLQKTEMFRPSSADFMAELVKSLDGDIESVQISLQEETFYATTFVVGHGKTMKVDGRPSDAIALAVRFDAPLFVVSDLLKPGTLNQVGGQIREQAAAQAREIREQAKPE